MEESYTEQEQYSEEVEEPSEEQYEQQIEEYYDNDVCPQCGEPFEYCPCDSIILE